jgi:hypothetical protein
MIIASRSYKFDEAQFELQFNRLDAGLRADTIRFVEFMPLNGFTSNMADIALADGVVLRPMTDRQVSRAIQVLAVPAEFSGGPNSVHVSRFHQWAVMREQGYPVRSYKQRMPEQPQAPDFPKLEEPAQRLVTALRIVCGGSVVATRPIHAQHDDDFPPTVDGSAALPAVVAADISRPTQVLTDEQAEAVREVYEMLGNAVVQEDRSLQVRCVDSCSPVPKPSQRTGSSTSSSAAKPCSSSGMGSRCRRKVRPQLRTRDGSWQMTRC